MKHKGRPIRIMSGEHGTLIVNDGDELPAWYASAPTLETPIAVETSSTLDDVDSDPELGDE